MAAAASRLFEAHTGRVQALLAESAKRLEPLGDPLATDFGLHRWLVEDREEAYSDWLQWILQQVQAPSDLFRLFRASEPAALQGWRGGPPAVERELWVPEGHAGQTGRLDLVVCYEGLALFVLEIKMAGAEQADTEKQRGYKQFLDTRREPHQFAILIAADAEEELYEGFLFLSWADLCLGMRRLARRFCSEGRLVAAAMTLAFSGAVEQNLLGLSTQGLPGRGSAAVNPRLVAYLERWLSEDHQ